MLNTELTVRCETEQTNFYKTDTGVTQGDGSSANEITSFLARALYKENDDHTCKKSTITTSSELSSISRHDHHKERKLHVNETKTEEYEII